MSNNVMKVVRVSEEVHQKLANLGNIGDTYNDVIKRLLDEREDYEEYLDIIEAEKEINEGFIRTYTNLDEFKEDIEKDVPFEPTIK